MSSQSKKTKAKKVLSNREFDERFDSGKSMEGYVDWSKVVKIVKPSLPVWMVKRLDLEAQRLNVDRQAIIKTWLADRIDQKEAQNKTAS